MSNASHTVLAKEAYPSHAHLLCENKGGKLIFAYPGRRGFFQFPAQILKAFISFWIILHEFVICIIELGN